MVEPNKRLLSIIDVNPKSKLVFNYVPKKTNISFISIKNISNGVVAYKVKTNRPQSYLVKSHEGILTQDQTCEVEITMQPTDYNPQTAVIDDKFLIVAMLLPPSPNPSQIPALWKSTPSEEQQQIKLQVDLRSEGSSAPSGRQSISKEATPDNSQVKTETKPESKPEVKPETKPEPKVETKPETKPEVKPEVKGRPSVEMNESSTLYKSALPMIEESQQEVKKVTPKGSDFGKKSTVGGQNSNTEERIGQLEKELGEVKAERDRFKSELEQSNIKRKSQEQFVFQLSEEKNKFENELNMLKNSTFKQKKDGGTEGKEGMKPIELWHIIVVAIISLLLGAFLGR